MQDLIKGLTDIYGPSGYEHHVRDFIQAEIVDYVDMVEVDALGNLHALKRGPEGGKTIMLAAHMDEIGLMVTNVEEEGYLRFTNIGGLFPLNMVSARVIFADGTLGMVDINWDERGKSPSMDNLYIDVGVSSKNECPIKVGDVAGFYGPAQAIGRRVMAKSLDDRIGCAVQIETLKQLKDSPYTVHFVFTVQEEVGLRGAKTSAFKVEPDIGIAIDVTLCGDVPEMKNFPISLGQGPAIKVMDRSSISHPAVKDWMMDTATANNIPYQPEVLTFGGTDAGSMQLSKGGAAAGCVSIPCRHIHTPSEMIDLDDAENAVKLLVAMLSGPLPAALENR